MILHPVLIFLLSWRCIGGEHVENISIESVLDQVAIPTKIINEFLQKPVGGSSSKKRVLQENVESSTIHYENSNGFVPLVPTQPYEFNQNRRDLTRNFSETTNETKSVKKNSVEDEFGYPVEASMFLNLPNPGQNRRSFGGNDQDEFELLKVSNGTPAVANYDSFYDDTKDAPKPEYLRSESNFKKPLRNKNRDRGKRIQSYLGTYDERAKSNERYEYNQANKGQKKNSYQQTTSAPQSHYKQDSGRNYRTQKSSLPKTNFASMATPKLNSETHSSNADKSEEHKFKGPIMVQPSEYKVDVKYTAQIVSTANPNTDVKAQMDSVSPGSETPEYSPSEGTNRNYESADSRDFSEDYTDYMDEIEKPRRSQKTRKRLQTFHSSRKLPKEHREVYDDVYDDQGRKRTRSKSRFRTKPKPTPVIEDQYDTEGDNFDENANNNQQNVNEGNTWNQISPNVEVSHSNGFEINQIEKPKLHIVPVNVLSNFDHATALDNSQGFDITNAMIIHEPIVSTAASLLSSSPNYIDQNLVSSTVKPPLGMSSSVPDIIVGQSSFNNPVQTVLMPNKLQQLNQYIQSTMSPSLFAVTPSPSFSVSSSISPSSLQQMLNQASFSIKQPFFNAQSNRQSYTNLLQPFQSNANNQIYLNSNGQSYNQFSNAQSTTTSRPIYEKPDSENKKNFSSNNGQFLASASLSVGQGTRPNANNKNSDRKRYHNNYSNNNNNNNNNDNNNKNDYKDQNNDDDNDYKVQNNQQTRQNANTFLQSTVVPTFLHAGIGLFNNQNHQLVQSPFFITNQQVSKGDAFGNSRKQTQYGVLNNHYQINDFSGIDNVGGASTNVNAINNLISPVQKAQLPILGAKNVEIINPNLNANAYAINQIPTALVTTPIPIFTTTGFIASKPSYSTTTQEPPVSVQNFVHSLTQIGTNAPNTNKKLNFNSILNIQGPDRPLYNPINFVPNYDLVRSQSILNQNVVQRDPFAQQNLNLVPLVPGGNFFKHSQGAQFDLANKPKLSSDLEKYAEEMFKESLRTMYNSHKWNNDPRPSASVNLTDNSELAKLRNELLRIRNNLKDSKIPKDVLEGHYTENKIRAVKPGSDYKRPDSSEQSYKQDHKHSGSHHHHHHRHKPKINDYLTPPRANSFISKSPFHDSRPPPKKRPGHGPAHGPRPNFNHDHVRPRPRQGVAPPKSNGIEGQASSVVDYKFPVRSYQEKPSYNQPDYRGFDTYHYPTFTTSSPENDYHRSSAEYRSSENNFYDINHQRTHNLMGLLMKNKQLPPGMQENSYYSDTQTVSQFFDEENRRTQTQAYGDALRSFQQKSDRPFRPSLQLNNIPQRVNTQPHQAV